jgi:uncharacterized membrane protein
VIVAFLFVYPFSGFRVQGLRPTLRLSKEGPVIVAFLFVYPFSGFRVQGLRPTHQLGEEGPEIVTFLFVHPCFVLHQRKLLTELGRSRISPLR